MAKRGMWKVAVAAAAVVPAMAGSAPAHAAGALNPGDLVIYRVGTGSGSLSSTSTAVFLDDYSVGGTLQGSVALPTTASGSNNPVVASGSATSEGNLAVTADGQAVVATGYDAAVGTASIASSTVPRDVAIVSLTGTVDSQTTTTAFSGNNIRSAVAASAAPGSGLWMAGANGIAYATVDSSGPGSVLSTQNSRSINLIGGQLEVSSASGSVRVATVGSGEPTSGTQTLTNLQGISSTVSASPYEFWLANPTSLYVADSTDGVQKYVLSGGNWNLSGTVAESGVTGITGSVSGAGTTLYFTTPSGLYTLTDTSGAGNLTGTPTLLASPGTNEVFRGIVLLPSAPTSQLPEVPWAPLLPIAGIVVGSGIVFGRRRFGAS